MENLLNSKIKIFKCQLKVIDVMFIGIISILAFLTRWMLINQQSADYVVHLEKWYQYYLDDPVYAIKNTVGDYTAIYNYILLILSLFFENGLYSIKIVSIIFDFIMAFVVLLILNEFSMSKLKCLLGYAIILFLPTVILNSGSWGQCDAIYCTFILLTFLMILKSKYKLSMIMFSVAFCIKLQSIFFLPILIYLTIKDKIKLSYYLIIPLVYLISAMPLLLCGNSLVKVLGTYFVQTVEYPSLTSNAPSIYAFLPLVDAPRITKAGILFAVAIVGMLILYSFYRVNINDKQQLLKFTVLILLIVPFLLPRMHERYFYLAEIMLVVYGLINVKNMWQLLVMMFVSTSTYFYFLYKDIGFVMYFDLRLLAIVVGFVISIIAYDFYRTTKVGN